AREVPRLPHVHGCRARARVRVPRLRSGVRRRPRPRPARVGRRRRRDVEAASLSLPYPEAGVIEEATLGEQTLALASELPDRPLDGVACVSVALACDVFDPAEVSSFMPEPGGLGADEVGALFQGVRGRAAVVGAGLTGLAPDPANVAPLERLCATLGL